MDKENIKLLYVQTIDCIDTIYINHLYDDIKIIRNMKTIIKNWYKAFQESKSLKGIDFNNILFLNIEINKYYKNYINRNVYIERLYNNYLVLEKEWKNQIIKTLL